MLPLKLQPAWRFSVFEPPVKVMPPAAAPPPQWPCSRGKLPAAPTAPLSPPAPRPPPVRVGELNLPVWARVGRGPPPPAPPPPPPPPFISCPPFPPAPPAPPDPPVKG